MIRPDFREFRGQSLSHSAKGTTWKDHKYIRIENGRYIYPKDTQATKKENKVRKTSEVAAEREEFYNDMKNDHRPFNQDLRNQLRKEGYTNDAINEITDTYYDIVSREQQKRMDNFFIGKTQGHEASVNEAKKQVEMRRTASSHVKTESTPRTKVVSKKKKEKPKVKKKTVKTRPGGKIQRSRYGQVSSEYLRDRYK